LVGELLRKAREESGKDLKEISNILKIRYAYLHAIEEEDFKKLPEEVYIKGYIREYAEFLNIDPQTAINAYIQQTSPPKVEKPDISEIQSDDKKKSKIRYSFGLFSLVLLVIIISYIIFVSSPKKTDLNHVPVENKMEIPPPIVNALPDMTKTATESKSFPEQSPAGTQEKLAIRTPVEVKKQIPLSQTDNEKKINLKGEKYAHILKLVASDTTWISVTSDGTDKKSILLKPGESITFQANNSFSLKIGNAGGIKAIFDGKEIENIGGKGQVVKLNLP
jgi:cytoskeletal protein RodZ